MRKIKSNLKKILSERGMDQKQLAELTGIREATISEMCRDMNKMFPRSALERIADKLQIDDVNELIRIEKEKDDQ